MPSVISIAEQANAELNALIKRSWRVRCSPVQPIPGKPLGRRASISSVATQRGRRSCLLYIATRVLPSTDGMLNVVKHLNAMWAGALLISTRGWATGATDVLSLLGWRRDPSAWGRQDDLMMWSRANCRPGYGFAAHSRVPCAAPCRYRLRPRRHQGEFRRSPIANTCMMIQRRWYYFVRRFARLWIWMTSVGGLCDF